MEQNREARNKPTHIYVQLIYEQRANNICNGEISVSSINTVGKIEHPIWKTKQENYLTLYTKVNSKYT